MRISWLSLASLGRAWTLVVLAALLLRAAIPAGFMPDRDDLTGQIAMVWCSSPGGQAPPHPVVPQTQDDDSGPVDTSCPFSLVHATEPPVPPDFALEAQAHVYRLALAPVDTVAGHDAWQANAPPTGPPARA